MPHCGDCPAVTVACVWEERKLADVQWRCPLTDRPVSLAQECDAPAEHLRRLKQHCETVLNRRPEA